MNTQTGRGPSGKLRNFRAMKADKLHAVAYQVVREANDSEALLELALHHDGITALAMVKLAQSI